ncbi:glycerophosphoryl diester phosphodiesterase [Labrenzia sp. EL_195]|nr:glycerophosphoryl diester phosphodiesterase [Labrenzia sp. EL_195]
MTSFLPGKTWVRDRCDGPLVIAHRGASAHAFDNTMRAFRVAHELGADMWEVDVRLTKDGVPVAFHDEDLRKTCGVDRLLCDASAEELFEMTALAGRQAPAFFQVARLAAELGAGIYLDAKEGHAASLAIENLVENRIERVIVGANTPEYCAELIAGGCPYPVSILVGPGRDPFAIASACGAELVHPCWEHASDRPDRLLDDTFFRKANSLGLPVVTWHEERADVLAELVQMPILGICSDKPEMVRPYSSDPLHVPEIVCHRGACRIAPENTGASARTAWDGGFDYVEIDVRETADGQLVLHHDETLERTTTGTGPLAGRNLRELQKLDAGNWFDAFFKGIRLPTLSEFVLLAAKGNRKLYVEIKQADAVKTAGEVFGKLSHDQVFFWSFDQSRMMQIRKAYPNARLMVRPEDYETLEDCLSAYDADIVEFNARNANPGDVAAVRAAGRKVMLAYMGDDLNVLSELAQLQPDLLNVNEPFLVRKMFIQSEKDGTSDG